MDAHRRTAHQSLIAAAIAALIVVLAPDGSLGQAGCEGAQAVPSRTAAPSEVAEYEEAILCLVNRERTSRGLRALRVNAKLERVARTHSRYMVRHKYFGHFPGGRSPQRRVRAAGYCSSCEVHENAGTGDPVSARGAVRNWMGSAIHRRNILNRRMRDTGIAYARGQAIGSGDGITLTQVFGRR